MEYRIYIKKFDNLIFIHNWYCVFLFYGRIVEDDDIIFKLKARGGVTHYDNSTPINWNVILITAFYSNNNVTKVNKTL